MWYPSLLTQTDIDIYLLEDMAIFIDSMAFALILNWHFLCGLLSKTAPFAAQYFIATDSGLLFVTWSAIQFQFTLPQMWQHFAHWIIDSSSSG